MSKTNETKHRTKGTKAFVSLKMFDDHVEQRVQGRSSDITYMIAVLMQTLAKNEGMELKEFYDSMYRIWTMSAKAANTGSKLEQLCKSILEDINKFNDREE